MHNIIIFGDSITWGAVDSKGGWVARLKNESGDNTIYNLGISGDTSAGVLKRLSSEATARLDEDLETVIVVAIGINDSQFELNTKENKTSLEEFSENLRKIVTEARKFGGKVKLVGLTPVNEDKVKPMPWKETHGYTNEQIEKYDNAIKNVAQEADATYIEIYSKFMEGNYKSLLYDGLHPNDKGHELICHLVKEFIFK